MPSCWPRWRTPSEQGSADWQQTLQEQLEFERFVAELSGQFINVPVEQFADATREGLRRVCEHVNLDRSVCYTIDAGGVPAEFATWVSPGVPSPTPAPTRFPWAIERVRAGLTVAFSTLADVPDAVDRESYEAMGVKSAVKMPLWAEGRVAGAVGFHVVRAERMWTPSVTHRLAVIASVFGEILARQRRDEEVWAGAREAKRLKEQLQIENVYLRKETRERLGQTRVVGRSAACVRVLEQVEQVAATDATVLLLGETGTGKELFATQIHEREPRRGRADGARELRRDPGDAHRERAVRPREGRLHRRAGAADRAASSSPTTRRSSSTRSASCRSTCRSSCCACSRSGRSSGSAARSPITRRHPHHRGDAPQSRAADRRETLPRGPVLPPERVPDPGAAAARARPRTSRCSSGASSTSSRGRSASGSSRFRRGQHGRAAALLVARQHPRAPQRRRARDDRRDGAEPDDPAAPARRRRRRRSAQADRRREGAHPRRAREHRLADPRRRRRRRAARAEADDARDADGEARRETAGPRLWRRCAAAAFMPGSGMPWTLCDTGPPALEAGGRRGRAFACNPFVRGSKSGWG